MLLGPGMTECPRCENIYVEWVNFKKWLEAQNDGKV